MNKWIFIFTFLILSLPQILKGAGYEVKDHDAEASARGLAVTARLDNPSVLFYNPAGICYLNGFNFTLGGEIILPFMDYSDPEGRRASAGIIREATTVPHLYATYNFSDKFGAGFGFNAPFGLSIKWPDGFAGEYKTSAIDLKVPAITFAASFKPSEKFSFGASLRLMPSSVEFIRKFNLVTDSGMIEKGYVHMGGNSFGIGGAVGIMARPIPNLFLGASYHGRVKLNFSGDADFYLPEGLSDESLLHDQGGSSVFYVPDILSFGIGYFFIEKLYLEFDLNYTLWSIMDKLTIKFPDTPELTETIPKNWDNTLTFRLGGDYILKEVYHIRFGGGYDWTPIPPQTLDPMLPDANRTFFSIGFGLKYKPMNFGADISYLFVYFNKRTVTMAQGNDFPASYSTIAHLIGFSLRISQ